MATITQALFLFCCLSLNLLIIIFPSPALGCAGCVNQSKLAYYAYEGAVDVGACGYFSYASSFYGGNVGGTTSSFYKNGVGCGACYKIRCTDPELCNNSGATIVVTDFTPNDQTDFVVSRRTFSSLAIANRAPELVRRGIIDIEFKRVPCEYMGQNMAVAVDGMSRYPSYLVVKFLYQGGQTDIVNVLVAQVGTSGWQYMARNYGAVWDITNPPGGALQFRFVVTSGYKGKQLWARKPVLPSDWRSGGVYDSGLQITDVAKDTCNACDDNDSG